MLRVAEQYAATDTGRQRRANEDSLLARAPLFAVADGMGGAQAGEVASRIAIECFEQGLGDTSEPETSLASRAGAANTRIHELSHTSAEHAGMGTTLTAVYVASGDVAIVHVGDSRAYRLRDGGLLRLTDDHSLVDELLRQGKITPEEAVDHPQRSVITRALGPEPAVEIDTRSYAARDGDVYLLCSDGLTTMLSEEHVGEIMRSHPVLREAGEALIAAANEAGGRDNITVVLFRLEDPSAAPGGGAPVDPATEEQAAAAPSSSSAPAIASARTAAAETAAASARTAAPETATGEAATGEAATGEAAAGEAATGEAAAPEIAASETAAPKTAAAETVAPETAVPGAAASETAGVDTTAPETVAAVTKASFAASSPSASSPSTSEQSSAASSVSSPPAPMAASVVPEPRAPVQQRLPRAPAQASTVKRSRARWVLPLVVALTLLVLIFAGAYLTLESVYFVGTDSRGLVTVYRGVPYELPGGIKLYSSEYVSGVAASSIAPARRRSLLDHTLRTESDASDLVRSLELGQLSE